MYSNFYVIGVCSNPVRYKSRIALYKKFREHMAESGAQLLTVEIAFGVRPFEVTEEGNPWDLQLRTVDEIWHKENMINLGLNYLSQIAPNFSQVAWIDGDVQFIRKDWLQE